jgi:drug/metabolite transporter (DMT)-like permease
LYTALALAAALVCSLQVRFNIVATGSPTSNTYRMWWPYDTVGFGPGHGRAAAGHTLADGYRNARLDLAELPAALLGWPAPHGIALAWLPVALASLPDHVPGLAASSSLLALGAGGTGVAFLLFYRSIAEVGPARASIVSYVAPAFAVLYGVLLLGEHLGTATVCGLALIVAGSWLGAQGALPWRSKAEEPVAVGANL